jgi:hypothetical protein
MQPFPVRGHGPLPQGSLERVLSSDTQDLRLARLHGVGRTTIGVKNFTRSDQGVVGSVTVVSNSSGSGNPTPQS